jgi:hypothetical protein
MMRLSWIAVVSSLVVVPSSSMAGDGPSATDVPDVIKQITARELGGHMKFLASDLMRGRDTASAEIRLAAEYIATRLSAAGADPVGDFEGRRRGYLQRFPLEVVTPQEVGTSLTLKINDANGARRVVPLQIGGDVTFVPSGLTPGEIEAPVVFAGYGQVDEARKIDDYADLNVKNAFVLVLAGQAPRAPADAADKAQPKAQGRRNRGGANGAKLEAASRRGAAGLIVIQPKVDNAAPRSTGLGAGGFNPFGRPSMTLGTAPASIPVFTLSDAIRDIIERSLREPFDKLARGRLEGVQLDFKYAAKKELKDDRNVVGFFPGSDPEKKKEVVIFSAHYDHVGVDAKGEIFNGSDDNASGTSALLEIAEAFGDGPRPARSVAFLWVSGEEKGLLGSQWFADNVSLPEDSKIVADINIDMVSRNDGKSIGLTPSETHASFTSLAAMARDAAKAEGLDVKYDADQYFERTDSANFARKGIPVVFFFSGIHEDYHRPTDDVEKADFEKAARVARAAYRLGWQVAQAAELPKKVAKAD